MDRKILPLNQTISVSRSNSIPRTPRNDMIAQKSNADRTQIRRINSGVRPLMQHPPNRLSMRGHSQNPEVSSSTSIAVANGHNNATSRSASLRINANTVRSRTPLQLVPPTAFVYPPLSNTNAYNTNGSTNPGIVSRHTMDDQDVSSDSIREEQHAPPQKEVYVEDVYFKPRGASTASLFPSSQPQVSPDRYINDQTMYREQSPSTNISSVRGRRRNGSVSKDLILSTLYPDNDSDDVVSRQVSGRRLYPNNINNSGIPTLIDDTRVYYGSLRGIQSQSPGVNTNHSATMYTPSRAGSGQTQHIGRKDDVYRLPSQQLGTGERDFQRQHSSQSYKDYSPRGRVVRSNDAMSPFSSMSRDDGVRHSTVSYIRKNPINRALTQEDKTNTPKPKRKTNSYNNDSPKSPKKFPEKEPVVVRDNSVLTRQISTRQASQAKPKKIKDEPTSVFVFTLRRNEEVLSNKRVAADADDFQACTSPDNMDPRSRSCSELDDNNIGNTERRGDVRCAKLLSIKRHKLREQPPSSGCSTRTSSTVSYRGDSKQSIAGDPLPEKYSVTQHEKYVDDRRARIGNNISNKVSNDTMNTSIDTEPNGPCLKPRIPIPYYSGKERGANGEVKRSKEQTNHEPGILDKVQETTVQKSNMYNNFDDNDSINNMNNNNITEEKHKANTDIKLKTDDTKKPILEQRSPERSSKLRRSPDTITVKITTERQSQERRSQERRSQERRSQERQSSPGRAPSPEAEDKSVKKKIPKTRSSQERQSSPEAEDMPVCSIVVKSNFVWDAKASWEGGVIEGTEGGDDDGPCLLESHIVAMDRGHTDGPF